MKPVNVKFKLVLMLSALALLLSGCAQPLPRPDVKPAAVPPLPPQAKQPTPPKECLPTCSAGLTTLRTESLDLLMKLTSPAEPAKASTNP